MNSGAPSITCKGCGGTAQYDFDKGSYRCPTCLKAKRSAAASAASGSKQKLSPLIETPDETSGPELSLEELERRFQPSDEDSRSRNITLMDCKGCGAQVEVQAGTSLAACPFCDRKVQVQTSRSTVGLYAPIVVPFALDHSQAVGKMVEHLDKLWLRPSFLRNKVLSSQHVRQVYLPFWAFHVGIQTQWNARVRKWKQPGLLGRMFGQEGHYYTENHSGHRGQRLTDWLVCSSHGLDAEMIEALEPFSIEQASSRPFTESLGQIPLERATFGPAAAWQKGMTDIRRRQYRASLLEAQRLAGEANDNDVSIDGKVDFGTPRGKAVVLPLYIFSTRTIYGPVQVVVNGETGRVASRIPYSWLKAAPVGVAGAAAAGAACFVTVGGFAPVLLGIFAYGWYERKKRRERNEATFISR